MACILSKKRFRHRCSSLNWIVKFVRKHLLNKCWASQNTIFVVQFFSRQTKKICKMALREKCPYSEFFWSAFSRIRTEYLSVFSSNPGNYGPEKLRIRILVTQCEICWYSQYQKPLNSKVSLVHLKAGFSTYK